MSDVNEQLDSYVSELAGIEDTTTDVTNEVDTSDTDGETQQLNEQQPAQGEQSTPQYSDAPASKLGKDGKPVSQKQPKTEQQEDVRNLRPLGDGIYQNRSGDLVDDKGRLIAKGGFAARIYQTNKRLKSQLEEQQKQLQGIGDHVRSIQGFAQTIAQSGLNNTEVQWALDAASRIKRGDDLGVAKEILAFIASKGYNVTDLLGSDVGDSIELKAINHMIDRRLAPITQEQQARQRQTEIEGRARQQYDAFIRENEFAEVHANDIARLAQEQGVSPQVAYNRIREFAASNRLDFSRPLQQQIAARQQQQQHQPVQQQAQPQRRPLPNGGATRLGANAPQAAQLAGADDDWGSIIRDVQRTLGN